ncbi:LysR substrate-binding domain-containing protein [Paradesertivirga mongoliensis]|uniref:LysR substrate-binding domain-containing protein n=1 Tax=Paradesertivirga mongoliensis TaxID=2100740 RepID=A0ABW4ZNH6_9SPHI|nr:LysR family transcriptional regulator [Pedobacter mongoliensis]
MIFDFRLKVFHTVASNLSFTKAASELFITQPAVTKHIHELEQHLGNALFKRNGNTISLTPAGEIVFRYAERIFETYASLESELVQLSDVTGGNLRIGASTTIAQNILPKILALFKKAYPSISYTFTQGNTDSISLQVIAEKLDIGLVEGNSHFPQIAYEAFSKDEIVLVTRSGGSLAKKAEIKPQDLLNIPLVLREQGSGTLDVVLKALTEVKINPRELNIETRFQSSGSIKQYLLNSDTAAFLSIQSILKELKYNELSMIDIEGVDIFRTFQFIQLHGNTSKLITLFKRFCSTHNLK